MLALTPLISHGAKLKLQASALKLFVIWQSHLVLSVIFRLLFA